MQQRRKPEAKSVLYLQQTEGGEIVGDRAAGQSNKGHWSGAMSESQIGVPRKGVWASVELRSDHSAVNDLPLSRPSSVDQES